MLSIGKKRAVARTKAPKLTATESAPEQKPAPIATANVQSSVGGKALTGAVQLVRLPGREVDVMLPHGTDFSAYANALVQSGAFKDQEKHLTKLQKVQARPGGGADPRPVVGIVISEPKYLVPGAHKNTQNVIDLVEQMGCRPVLIPPCADLVVKGGPQARGRAIAAMASQLDGLVGPGGADVHPAIYNKPTTHAEEINLLRDKFEADFVNVALDCDLYGFGICRSHQLWNAAAGGSLVQDVQKDGLTSVSHQGGHLHDLHVSARSAIFEATRKEWMKVNTYHHQAVDFAGWGFRVVARVRDEGTGKEMIEATERWNAITTQYHPELMQEDEAQRALFSTVGRRAHIFQIVKHKKLALPELLQEMKKDPRYDDSDVAWVKRDLARRL